MKFSNQLFTAVCLNGFNISLGDAVSPLQLTQVWAAAGARAPVPSEALSAPVPVQQRGEVIQPPPVLVLSRFCAGFVSRQVSVSQFSTRVLPCRGYLDEQRGQ